jgi:hypothetical protein
MGVKIKFFEAPGLVHRLPMHIEPMKMLAVAAIAGRWQPSMVHASGVTMGVVWLVFGLTGVVAGPGCGGHRVLPAQEPPGPEPGGSVIEGVTPQVSPARRYPP